MQPKKNLPTLVEHLNFSFKQYALVLQSLVIFSLFTGCTAPSMTGEPPTQLDRDIQATAAPIKENEDIIMEAVNGKQSLTAEVLMVSASGKILDEKTLITSENIAEYAPAPEAVAQTQQYFTELGFDVGSLGGISFAISGSADLFSQTFASTIMMDTENGGFYYMGEDNQISLELPLSALSASLQESIVKVTFMQPLDFGPSNFSSP